MFLRGRERLQKVRSADLIVALTSSNNAGSIRYVAETLAHCLRSALRDLKALIVNIDGGSQDGTSDEFQRSAIHRTIEYFTLLYPPTEVETQGYQDIFASARELDARFVIFIAADSLSFKTSWLSSLVMPLMEGGYHYLSPLFSEAPCFTLARDFIHYPLFASLFGLPLRAPHPDHFALSGTVMSDLIIDEAAPEKYGAGGAAIAVTGIERRWRIAESALGVQRREENFFRITERYAREKLGRFQNLLHDKSLLWRETSPARIERLGEVPETLFPSPIIDPRELWTRFGKGMELHRETIDSCLSRVMRNRLAAIAARPLRLAEFPAAFWAELIIELVLACHTKRELTVRILTLLPSLCYGRVAPIIASRPVIIPGEWEKALEEQAMIFAEKKKDFIARWE
jgi:glucosylglycerate synthase